MGFWASLGKWIVKVLPVIVEPEKKKPIAFAPRKPPVKYGKRER